MPLSKFIFSGISGAAVATGLGLIMVKLIHVDYEAKSKLETLDFTINPEIEPMAPPGLTAQLPERKDNIEIPPAVDRIEPEQARKPTEKLVADADLIMDFEIPDLDLNRAVTIQIDRPNPDPIIRFAGKVPDIALREGRSGHCNLVFSVDTMGATYDIRAKNCTHSMFERNSIKAAEKFKYRPAVQDGQPVDMHGVTTRIRYVVTDEAGNALPE